MSSAAALYDVVMHGAVSRWIAGQLREPAGRPGLITAPGTAAAIPYGPRSFDRVLTVDTISFWPDPAAGVRSIFGVLDTGGRVVLALETREAMAARGYSRHGFRLFGAGEIDGPHLYASGRRP